MSREYAESRIREALRLHRGNITRARQQIMAWTFEDVKLLQALSRPHLTGIVAHAVSRVVYHQNTEETHEESAEMPKALNMGPDTFGKAILRALASDNTAVFGQESSAPPVGRKQASKSHIDALRMMASKARKKDD